MSGRSDRDIPRLLCGRRRRIGLLGGSFNPAHAGHLHISRLALKQLGLDEVWWLVSPQNPLKPAAGMAPLERRLEGARAVAADRRIRVSSIEQPLATRYTVDTLRLLKQKYKNARFVWLIGADNLLQLPKWKDWSGIFHMVPIAVFARDTYDSRALTGQAALRFARYRLDRRAAGRLAATRPPAWVFLANRRHPASATRIRSLAAGSGGTEA